MAIQDRVLVLTETEQAAFYGPPSFTVTDQRYFFALNDKERSIARKFPDAVQTEARDPAKLHSIRYALYPIPANLQFGNGIRESIVAAPRGLY